MTDSPSAPSAIGQAGLAVRRVAIVDDEYWIRVGRQAGLSSFEDFDVVAVVDHNGALDVDWSGVDIAIVDAHDPLRKWDRYPGVGVVETIRRSRSPDETTIIITSGRMFDPLLRLRMAEAGADFFYSHLDAPDPASLADLLRHQDGAHSAAFGDGRELGALGLRTWSRPNEALHWIEDSGANRFFTDQGTQKSAPASRRVLSRARDEVARLARLDPSLGDPERRPGDVTWRDVVRFVNRALGRDG